MYRPITTTLSHRGVATSRLHPRTALPNGVGEVGATGRQVPVRRHGSAPTSLSVKASADGGACKRLVRKSEGRTPVTGDAAQLPYRIGYLPIRLRRTYCMMPPLR